MGNFLGPEMLLRIPALLIAITFHEYAHARMSDALGDPTPKWTGRLSLNPLAHLDPVGLLMLWFFRFGWAKPVEVNPYYYKNPRKGILIVSLAGPVANILLAFITLLILKLNFPGIWWLSNFISVLFMYNLVLAVFNLLPIPPLDGSKIFINLLPRGNAAGVSQIEAYGPLLLIFMAYFGILNIVLNPLILIIHKALDTLSNLILFELY